MFESLFFGNVLKLCCEVCLKNNKDVFASFDQVTKSYLPYFTPKILPNVFNPFDSVVSPLHLVNNLVLGYLNGTGTSHRIDHDSNCAKYFWQFS